uniref:Nucleolin 1 n=1 Tax=Noccaea caerulescens TaxID=107243 RepID=A0A1J3IB67_NOCCA
MGKSVKKGMKLLEGKGGDAAIPQRRKTGRIRIEGYDTGLAHDDAVRKLRKLFSTCGEMTDVYIGIIDDKLSPYAYIYFTREDAVDKALQRHGKHVGGWILHVEAIPVPECASSCPCFMIKGYDTSLSNKAIKKAARKHFSSCGTLTRISILRSTGAALVFLLGEQAAEKALELGAFYIRGLEVVVKLVSTPINPTFHNIGIRGRRWFPTPGKEAKMTAE